MERFNPITDLQPIDNVGVPTPDISDEIESLRLRLIQTKKETDNIINIIKDTNSSLNSDLKKIKNLNRRLNITIPRIPSMPGEAGVQFGEEVEQEKRRKRLGIRLPPRLPFMRFPSRVPSRTPNFKRAKLQKVVSNIKRPLDLYGGARAAKTSINIAKNKTLRRQIIKKFEKSQPLELPKRIDIRPLKKTVSKGKGTSTGGNVVEKTINRVRKFLSPKKSEVPLNTAERMSTAYGKNRSIINKNRTEPFEKFEKLIGNNPEAQFQDYLKKSKLSSPLKLKIDLNKALKTENEKLIKLRDSGKINDKVFKQRSNETFNRYKTEVERINRYDLEVRQQFERIKNFFKKTPKSIEKKSQKPTLIDEFTKKQKEIRKKFPEAKGFKEKIDPSFSGDVRMKDDGTFEYFNKDPNLISLNTDTSVTNTVIILTDPPIV